MQDRYAQKSAKTLESMKISFYIFLNLVSSALICSEKSEKWPANYLFVAFSVKESAMVVLLKLQGK